MFFERQEWMHDWYAKYDITHQPNLLDLPVR